MTRTSTPRPHSGAAIALAGVLIAGGCRSTPTATTPEPAPGATAAAMTDDAVTPAAATPPVSPPPVSPPRAEVRIEAFPGVTVVRHARRPAVEIRGRVCLQEGFLEQVACSPGTREHEALVVPEARPSQIHAALLMAGFEPGAPGVWTYDDDGVGVTPPSGAALAISVRYRDEAGRTMEEPVGRWIRDHDGGGPLPDEPFVFGGSLIERAPDGSERYVADGSGSIIGLVTFGDEVVGFSRVLADVAEIRAPEWEADPVAIPPLGTDVTLIVRPFDAR